MWSKLFISLQSSVSCFYCFIPPCVGLVVGRRSRQLMLRNDVDVNLSFIEKNYRRCSFIIILVEKRLITGLCETAKKRFLKRLIRTFIYWIENNQTCDQNFLKRFIFDYSVLWVFTEDFGLNVCGVENKQYSQYSNDKTVVMIYNIKECYTWFTEHYLTFITT